MNYKVLHLREEHMRRLGFLSLERIGPVDLGNYEVVYDAEMVVPADREDWRVLEELFRIFNLDHPEDYRAHSMSVGDIVMLDRARLFFCDSVGWVELTGENAPVRYSRVVLDVSGRAAQ